MSQNKSITPPSADDPLHIIRNNRHSRTNRYHKKVTPKDIHRFNMLQGSIPEKSEQWIDSNCPSFEQTIQNANVYRSEETPTPTPPLTPLNKISYPKCAQPKSRRQYKNVSKNKNNKKFKKRRKKYKNRNHNNKNNTNTKKVTKSQLKHIDIDLTTQKSNINTKKVKKTPKDTELLKSIKQILSKTEYKTFTAIVKLLRSMEATDSKNILQFEQRIMNPLIKLFDMNNTIKKHLLKQLITIMPAFYYSFYKRKLNEIDRKAQILKLCSPNTKKKSIPKSKNKNKNNKQNSNSDLLSLHSMGTPSFSQSLSQDWHCSLCNMSNISQANQCEACNGPKYDTSQSQKHKRKVRKYNNNAQCMSQPYMHTQKNVVVNGKQLDTISNSDSGKLYKKLDALREVLKEKYNIRQLHLVYSEIVLGLMSKYAPVDVGHLKYFDIMPMKIDRYGNEIVNVIKEYLHANGIISPFLKQSQSPPVPPMFGNRKGNYSWGRYVNCKYCFNLFGNGMIETHETNCVMREICTSNGSGNLELDLDGDIDLINEMNVKNPIVIDNVNDIDVHVIEVKDNEVNMNELDEVGFLTVSELEKVNIDFSEKNKEEDVIESGNGNDNNGKVINYFDEMDDDVFTQMVIDENNEKGNDKDDKKEENENGFVRFESDEFVDDNGMLECLKEIEQRISMKNGIKKELEETKLKLGEVKRKENEIKEQRNVIELEINDLEKRLLELN